MRRASLNMGLIAAIIGLAAVPGLSGPLARKEKEPAPKPPKPTDDHAANPNLHYQKKPSYAPTHIQQEKLAAAEAKRERRRNRK